MEEKLYHFNCTLNGEKRGVLSTIGKSRIHAAHHCLDYFLAREKIDVMVLEYNGHKVRFDR